MSKIIKIIDFIAVALAFIIGIYFLMKNYPASVGSFISNFF